MVVFKSLLRYVSYALLVGLSMANSHARPAVILSPPVAREITVPPPGSSRCYEINPQFRGRVWQNRHRICEYGNGPGFRMWIEGHWQCISMRRPGVCARWQWVGRHWARPYEIEARRPLYNRLPSNIHSHSSTHRPPRVQIITPNNQHRHESQRTNPIHGHD